MAKLVIQTGRNAGAEFKLDGDRLIIGRQADCPIPIADPKVSREHAVVLRQGEVFFLQDLSRNGTLLNGLPVSKTKEGAILKFNDRIKVGDTTLEMIDEGAEPINIEIPGYKISERIGVGGMGAVYKAKQLSMDRIVALKILHERYSANNEFVERFIREARAAGKLNHPNIIHVHDIAYANGRHYFSMEYVDGATVKEILRREKKLDYHKALDIVLQCARALEFAHENQIVHRDVKPDNIMLSKEGIVKIADLGIAKTFEETAPSAKETRRVMGTPHYMSPEQALGKTIDHRADIYSLGATFYHMIVGNTPFTGGTAHEILKAHVQESLPAIQDSASDIPDTVCFIIERMMAKLPDKRYPSMSKVIEDIERAQKGAAIGIDRIDAGDSTILRATQNAKKNLAETTAQTPTRSPINKITTGIQTPQTRIYLTLALTAVFAATVAIVVILAQKFSINSRNTTPQDTPIEQKTTEVVPADVNVLNRGNPEAKKLLAAAQQTNNEIEREKILAEISQKYPASLEAEEANKKLAELMAQRQESARQHAQGILNDAKSFESANQEKLAECIAKYEQVISASRHFSDILEPAKIRLDDLKKRLIDQTAKQLEASFKLASETANAHKNKDDYDAARATLRNFIDQNVNAPQKILAQRQLDQLNAEAQERFKKTQNDASNLGLMEALALWNAYILQIKDSAAVNDAKTARDAIENKARILFDDEMKKAGDKTRQFDYKSALDIIHAAQKRLTSGAWTAALKTNEEDVKKQKNLCERVIAAIQEGLKNGPIVLNFEINLSLGKKWKIVSIEVAPPNYIFKLDAIDGPGINRRLDQLTPKEQRNLFLQFLPSKLSDEDRQALEILYPLKKTW